jgi:hypothetical protein
VYNDNVYDLLASTGAGEPRQLVALTNGINAGNLLTEGAWHASRPAAAHLATPRRVAPTATVAGVPLSLHRKRARLYRPL